MSPRRSSLEITITCLLFMEGLVTATPGSRQESESSFHHLSRDVIPLNYQIHVEPDLVNFTFEGDVVIDVMVMRNTPVITLNAAELAIRSVTLTSDGDRDGVRPSMQLDDEKETLTLTFPALLEAGTRGRLEFIYTGILNDLMRGFYRSRNPGTNGSPDTYSAVTQFESIDARRMFPSWDEPDFKASFDISVTAAANLTTLSNMPVVWEQQLSNGKKRVTFERTPVMSSYLVAIVVGDYSFRETMTDDGSIRVRVYAAGSKVSQGQFALDLASRALTFYADYFSVPFPLPKMDMIAITDYDSGAMENWGLITYLESSILVDPDNSSAGTKQIVAITVCHEIAHQWFGNLVTMKWWDNLWLNEGFAEFMMYLCIDALLPEFDIWQEFMSETFMTAMRLDAKHSSHPIEVPINDPAEIDEVFDDISYEKGSSVIRMLHHYLGNEDFQSGLSLYLNQHAYGNTRTEDLWDALTQVSGKPVSKVMDTWTKQMGYPVISVDQWQEGTTRRLILSQTKFSSDGNVTDDERQQAWMIPVSVISGSSPDEPVLTFVMTNRPESVVVPDVASYDWIKLNPNAVSFYRVLYSRDMLQDLVIAVREKDLSPIDRLTIYDDVFALAKSGTRSTVDALSLLEEAYMEEDEYVVWSAVTHSLSDISLIVDYTEYDSDYNSWGRTFLRPVFTRVGMHAKPDEQHTESLLRSTILTSMVMFEEGSVIEESKRMFADYFSGKRTIPANIRGVVYSAVALDAGEVEYQQFMDMFTAIDRDEEKSRILSSMGNMRNGSLIQRLLTFGMTDKARGQDLSAVIAAVSRSRIGREVAWQFMRENEEFIRKRYEGPILGNVVHATAGFASREKANEVEAYFADHPWTGAEKMVAQAVESIRVNADWLDRDRQAVKQFLAQRRL